MTLIFNTLRIPLANHKTLGPVQELEYLGIMLNSKELMAFLPTDKRIGISKKLSEVLAKKSVTKQVLLSLLGHLSFAGRVVLPGRSFVSHLLQLASIVPKLHYHVAINSDCRMELAMWDSFLQSWNGVHLFLNSEVTSAADLQIYTDASSTVGFGGYFRGEWFNDCRPAELNMNNRSDLSMALLELYPIVVAAMLWGGKWSQKRIRFNCDNEATVHIINKGRASSKCQTINKLIRRLTLLAMRYNFIILARFLPGVHNGIADSLSCFHFQKFRQLAPAAQQLRTQCPLYCEVTQI
ncbi:uncharacterized protein LOC102807207 [Saccoglossus kowalevskii]